MTDYDPELVAKIAQAIASVHEDEILANNWADLSNRANEARARAVLDVLSPVIPRVQIDDKLGSPTYCRVWLNDVLIFSGRDFSGDLTV